MHVCVRACGRAVMSAHADVQVWGVGRAAACACMRAAVRELASKLAGQGADMHCTDVYTHVYSYLYMKVYALVLAEQHHIQDAANAPNVDAFRFVPAITLFVRIVSQRPSVGRQASDMPALLKYSYHDM